MADRPPLVRGSSDPLTDSTGGHPREHLRSHSGDASARSESPPKVDGARDPVDASSSHSSPTISRRNSGDVRPQRDRPRVRFGPGGSDYSGHQPVNLSQARPKKSSFYQNRGRDVIEHNIESDDHGYGLGLPPSTQSTPPHTQAATGKETTVVPVESKPSPASPLPPHGKTIVPKESYPNVGYDGVEDNREELENVNFGDLAAQSARSRAELLSESLAPGPRTHYVSVSEPTTPQSSLPPSPDLAAQVPHLPHDLTPYIPLKSLSRRKYGIDDESESEGEEVERKGLFDKFRRRIRGATRQLLYSSPKPSSEKLPRTLPLGAGFASGYTTPDRDKADPFYVERPDKYRRGLLGMLLELYGDEGVGSAISKQHPSIDYYRQHNDPQPGKVTPNATPGTSPASSPPSSGHATPKPKLPKWKERNPRPSSLTSLIMSSTALSAPAATKNARHAPTPPRRGSGPIELIRHKGKRRIQDHYVPVEMHVEIAELLARHEYMIKSCKLLMKYGAPTHRLEEYMRRSARKLQLDGQFLYMPGCMIISFDSPETRTTEVKIVRENQGVDLGRLLLMHDIYKNVIHGKMNVQEANEWMNNMMVKKPLYNKAIRIFFYGVASASVGPFGFGARPLDIPVAFVLGAGLGVLQLIIAEHSESYLNVFEISAAVVTSFAARGLGSINGGNTFCFPALAQSAIALILPGFIVLSAALELQSRNIVAGSVRMVYAIIYSLFLGFGITIGVAFYGAVDSHATQATECPSSVLSGYWKFAFVPIFTLSLCVVNQAKARQMPMMLVISVLGYAVNYFSAKRFANNAQIANTLGALAVGLVGNLYSRLYQGMSAAAILPAIFVQVPSGIAASGSLISGVASANQLLNGTNGVTTVSNGTQAGRTGINVNNTVFNVGYTMIQIAIGLTVGLFFSSLVVYPFGKKRSGLFSF